MAEQVELSIVIPCYNEGKRLDVAQISLFLNKQLNVLLCFVDDGSKDNTLEVLHTLQNNFPTAIEIISTEKNGGKAEAVRTGVLHCSKHFNQKSIAYIDADLATSIEECVEISTQIHSKVLFAFGSRISKIDNQIDRKTYRFYIGRIIATAISHQLGVTVYDTQCGCKIIENELAKKIFQQKFISKWLFDVELFHRIIAIYGREKIAEICREIPLKKWIDIGESKVQFTYFFKLWFDLFKIGKTYKTNS